MCSINGFISQEPLNPLLAKRLSSALLYFGAERGDQSAGVYSNGMLAKQAVSPKDFISSKYFDTAFNMETKLVLGHTRFPTCGLRTDEQAQPFKGKNGVVTVHNGWYDNMQQLGIQWGIKKKSGVDSELITSFISEYGIKMLPKFLETTSGPSAIAVSVNGELYLATAGNPIAYCSFMFNGNRIMVFASTTKILENALRYCFLADTFPIKEVEDGFLFKVTPKRLKVLDTIDYSVYGYGSTVDKFGYTESDYWEDYGEYESSSGKIVPFRGRVVDATSYSEFEDRLYDHDEVPNDKFFYAREELIEKLVEYAGEEYRDQIESMDEVGLEDTLMQLGVIK